MPKETKKAFRHSSTFYRKKARILQDMQDDANASSSSASVLPSIETAQELEQIGTTKLSYIARGYVKVGKIPNLCYVDTIDWKRIGKHSVVKYQAYRNDCSPCPDYCNGYCWNQHQCQVFTDNCHTECLGCTKNNSNAHCEVCKNYVNDGKCVAQCPPDKYTLQMIGKCVSRAECLARNQLETNETSLSNTDSWFMYDGECRNDCPDGTEFNAKINSCQPCGNTCIKYCYQTELSNSISIENIKGCTHINGSVLIVNLMHGEVRESLQKNLKSLRYIRDYLLIARNDAIEDLEFLPNLTEIGGFHLYANKSLFVFDNHNLKKLWKTTSNVTLKIRNGNIGFHDNEQLCLTEIERFAEKANIKYSDTDVSKYSNGIYCHEETNTGLQFNITNVNTTNVTIVWEKKYGDSELYYTIHYRDSNFIDDRKQDICSFNGWEMFSTANNSARLDNLQVFTTYQFYIVTYLNNMESKKSSINTFQTLPDDPDSPSVFKVYPITHDSMRLVWTKPYRTNGNLSSFKIIIYREDDDPDIVNQRDYCTNPFSDAGAKVDKVDDHPMNDNLELEPTHQELLKMYDLGPTEKTLPDDAEKKCGQPTNQEIHIRLDNNIWLFLCDKNSESKYCSNHYYESFGNTTDTQIWKRSIVKTSSRKKSSLLFKKGIIFNETVGPHLTNYTINYLRQFTLYVFYIKACNEDFNGKALCSSVLQASARTLRKSNADDISDFSAQIVDVFDVVTTWSIPKNPSAFIVSYNVYYRRNLEHSKNQTQCISQAMFLRSKKLTLKNLSPGGYYITVQAVSLAGPGNFSEMQYVVIVASFNRLWILLICLIILALIIIGGAVIYFRVNHRRLLDDIQLIQNINPEYTTVTYEADEWEMDRDDIDLHRVIGNGTFGRVFLGTIKSRHLLCAVKTVNEESSQHDRDKFLDEATTMKEVTKGAHVVKLYGVVSKSQPPLVVMELMEHGDLKKYLLGLGDSSQCITSNEIYRMAIEIADGLAYLTSRKFVHRDLAARNCMVSNDKTVKIGDFGMTRDIYQSDYYKKGSGSALLPVRWMAPESLADGVNTSDSDIWSYGIVLWEIVTLASQPYQGLSNEEVTQFVVSKGTLNRPADSPNLLWEIMRKCWDWYPTRRPTSFEIIDMLQDHVGPNFKSLSFYHSAIGQEYLTLHGSERLNNPPALAVGGFRYEEDQSELERDPLGTEQATCQPIDHEFFQRSSPKQAQRLSRQFQ